MQATLIYNPNSGKIARVNLDELIAALAEVGYQPIYEATGSEQDLDSILADVKGVVVVAGGDGTVRSVATRLLGKRVPLSLLPLGTANNIGNALGIKGEPLEIIAGLRHPYRRYVDVGYVQAPWGDDYFIEGFGYGLFADMLAAYNPNLAERKSLLKTITSTITTLTHYQICSSYMTLDDQDISGDYLLVEVLNTPAIGLGVKLAPHADVSDGLFEVIRIREDERDGFSRYVTSLLNETLETLPSVEIARGRKLEFYWTGFYTHVDGELRPEVKEMPPDQSPAPGARPASSGTTASLVRVEVMPQALEFWLSPPRSS